MCVCACSAYSGISEPVAPGSLCPSEGNTSGSVLAPRTTAGEPGWAARTFPGLSSSLDCIALVEKCSDAKPRSWLHRALCSPAYVTPRRGCGISYSRGHIFRWCPLLLREQLALASKVKSHFLSRAATPYPHPQLMGESFGSCKQCISPGWPENSLAPLHQLSPA